MLSNNNTVKDVLNQIREKVQTSLQTEVRTFPKYKPSTEFKHDDATALIDYDELNYMNANWSNWAQAKEITSHRKFIGPIIVRLKRMVVDIFWKYLLEGYFEREKQFHMQLVRYLNANARYIDNRDYKNFWQLANKVDNDVTAMNDRMDRLHEHSRATIVQLQSEIAQLKQQLKQQ